MQTRTIEGTTYTLVTKQRRGGAVYRSQKSYVRIGEKAFITRVLAMHRHLEQSGFPVPKLLSSGEIDGEAYFVEESLGDKRLLELFEIDTNETGAAGNTHFQEFLHVVDRFLQAQIKSGEVQKDFEEFARVVHLEKICEELPAHAEFIRRQFKERLERLADFPHVITHVDFNPANMYPNGVIDFEDTSTGPLGYDAATAITVKDWFPPSKEFEYFERYRFTDRQREEYFAHCDRIFTEHGYPKFSESYEDFAFFRAMWLTVGMAKWPKLQKHRHELFIDRYLKTQTQSL